MFEAELREHMEDIEALDRKNIQNHLGSLKAFAKSLAENDLIINSLVDIEGRNNYIPIFFSSLVGPLSKEARTTLVDYRGRVIASSTSHIDMPSVTQSMVEQGTFVIDTDRLLIVEPILISGYAEGAIVLIYPSITFSDLFGSPVFPHSLFVTDDNNRVVYSTNDDLATVGEIQTGPTPDGWLEISTEMPRSNIQLTSSASLGVTLKAMQDIQAVRLIGLAALLLVSIGLVLLSTAIVSRPLKRFSAVISSIKGVKDLEKRLDTKGPSEISEIASAFNRMEDWLQTTTVSRNYMDSIFGSITEGIVTIDAKGLITTFNASASKLFGYNSEEVIGQNVSILMQEEERQEHDVYIGKARFHEARIIAQNRDLQGRRKDGSLFPLELTVTPLEEGGLNGYVGTIRDITERKLAEQKLLQRSRELKRMNRELEFMALNDTLTGLGNRNQFTENLCNLIASCKRNQTSFSLLMMDLNKFKEVNDSYGHEAGDEVLRVVGERFKELSREADRLFRLGGDEFAALITTSVTDSGLAIMAERIIQTIEIPIAYDSTELSIGISIGIAVFPDHSKDEEQLLRIADNAMYQAKRGRLGYLIAPTHDKSATA